MQQDMQTQFGFQADTFYISLKMQQCSFDQMTLALTLNDTLNMMFGIFTNYCGIP